MQALSGCCWRFRNSGIKGHCQSSAKTVHSQKIAL
ncbi:hypothetical protein KY305_12615 [Bacillus sp. YC2]|nr:hypothetical protein [Bacillus sp. YC2]